MLSLLPCIPSLSPCQRRHFESERVLCFDSLITINVMALLITVPNFSDRNKCVKCWECWECALLVFFMSHLTFGRFLVASNTNVICQDSSLAIQLCVTLSGDCDYPIHASATDLLIGDSWLRFFGEVFCHQRKTLGLQTFCGCGLSLCSDLSDPSPSRAYLFFLVRPCL